MPWRIRQETHSRMRHGKNNKMRHGKNSKNGMGAKEDKCKGQQNEHTRAEPPPICTQPIQERWAHGQGIQMVWFGGEGKRGLFQGSYQDSFWEKCLTGMAFHPKEVSKGLGPPDACHRGRKMEGLKPLTQFSSYDFHIYVVECFLFSIMDNFNQL